MFTKLQHAQTSQLLISEIASCQNWQISSVAMQNWQISLVAKIGKCCPLPTSIEVIGGQSVKKVHDDIYQSR